MRQNYKIPFRTQHRASFFGAHLRKMYIKKIEIWMNENTNEDEEKERQEMEMDKGREIVFCAKLYMADLQAAFTPMSCNTSLTSASISPSSVAPNGMATR